MRRALPCLMSLCAVAALCSCGSPRTPGTAQEPTPSPSIAILTEEPMDDLPERDSPEVTGTYVRPTWDLVAQVAAVDHATATLTAYFNTGQSREAWFAGLKPYLTISAQQVYVNVDPANIGTITPTPGARIVSDIDEAHLFSTLVQVPTAEGVFAVILQRNSGNDWLAERILFPGTALPEEYEESLG